MTDVHPTAEPPHSARPPTLVIVVEDGILQDLYYSGDPVTLDVVSVDIDAHALEEYVIARDAHLAPLDALAGRPLVQHAVAVLARARDTERVAFDHDGRRVPDDTHAVGDDRRPERPPEIGASC